MTATTSSVRRFSALVWTACLTGALTFAGLDIRVGGQAQKPTPPPAAGAQVPAKPGTSAPATASQGATSPRGDGQGANAQGPGRGEGNRPGARIGPSVPGQPGGPPWWRDEAIKKELALKDAQIQRLDRIFDARAKDLEPLNDELDKQRAELSRLMADRTAGTAAIALQVARMEVPRAKINESFYLMMYKMSLILDPEQYKKLQAIFERNQGRGRGGQNR